MCYFAVCFFIDYEHSAGGVVTVTFQQVDGTPHVETGPQSDNQSFFVCESLGRVVSDLRAGVQVYETAYPAFPAGRGVIAKQ